MDLDPDLGIQVLVQQGMETRALDVLVVMPGIPILMVMAGTPILVVLANPVALVVLILMVVLKDQVVHMVVQVVSLVLVNLVGMTISVQVALIREVEGLAALGTINFKTSPLFGCAGNF